MKILIVVTNADRAGAQKHIVSIISGLKENHEYFVVVGSAGYLTEQLNCMGIPYLVISDMRRSINFYKDLICVFKIRKILREFDPTILHLHSAKASSLGRVASIGFKHLKVVYTVHGWSFSEGNSYIKKLVGKFVEKALVKRTDFYILVSKYDESLGQNMGLFANKQYRTIYNGVRNIEYFPTSKKTTIVSITRFAKQKNIHRMLMTFGEIEHNFSAVIAGKGPTHKAMCELRSQLGLVSKVDFCGEIEDVHTALKTAKIYLMTSDWEGLPIALIEALRAGLPIVSTNVGGVSEIVKHGKNGYLVDQPTAKNIAKLLESLISNDSLCSEMGQKSREIYLSKFRLEEMIDSTSQVYELVAYEGGR